MRSIELFAGAGGLGIGVSRAGFHPLTVVEWNRYCCDTLRENQLRDLNPVREWPLAQADIRQINFMQYEGKVDLVSGGPPCQPFSIGGKHRAHTDVRDMFPEAVRVIRETRPRAFLFENVKGLTRETFANYFEYLRLQLTYPGITIRPDERWLDHLSRLERHHIQGKNKGLHYNLVTRVLNAANYGIPQRRERVFFVGFRADLNIEWNFPKETHSHDALLWEQLHGDEYRARHSLSKRSSILTARFIERAKQLKEKPRRLPWRTVRDALLGIPDPEREPSAAKAYLNHGFQAGARRYTGHTGSPLDEPAKTLKAGVHGVPGGENMLLRSDGSVRYFTIRESARLQTFPDDFLFHGAWSEAMRQLGNAVPVSLAELLARDIKHHLSVEKK